jgi:hypothetical protein
VKSGCAVLSITEILRAANERGVLSNDDASGLRRDVDALRYVSN